MGRAGGGGSSGRSMGGGIRSGASSMRNMSSRPSSSSRNMGSSSRAGSSLTSSRSSTPSKPSTPSRPTVGSTPTHSRPVVPPRPVTPPSRPYIPPVQHSHTTVIIKEKDTEYSRPSYSKPVYKESVSNSRNANTYKNYGGYTNERSEGNSKSNIQDNKEHKLMSNIENEEHKKNKRLRLAVVFAMFTIASLIITIIINATSKSNYPLELTGTQDVGYVKDFAFFENSSMTSQACEYFKEKTGISLMVYAMQESGLTQDNADNYTKGLYGDLFKDENHAILAYYNDIDYWSWASGENTKHLMTEAAWNRMIDRIYDNWYNDGLTNDEVFAKGITKYVDGLNPNGDIVVFLFGLVVIILVVITVINFIATLECKSKLKNYKEQLNTIQTEKILSTDLDKFGDKELADTMKKYDV